MIKSELKPNWEELCHAYQNRDWQIRFYLDTFTGRTIGISEETWQRLEAVTFDLDQLADLDEASQTKFQIAYQVAMHDSRYLKVPEQRIAEYRNACESFATRCEPELRDLLFNAINNNDLIRFVLILDIEPVERNRWNQFQAKQCKLQLTRWLERSDYVVT